MKLNMKLSRTIELAKSIVFFVFNTFHVNLYFNSEFCFVLDAPGEEIYEMVS